MALPATRQSEAQLSQMLSPSIPMKRTGSSLSQLPSTAKERKQKIARIHYETVPCFPTPAHPRAARRLLWLSAAGEKHAPAAFLPCPRLPSLLGKLPGIPCYICNCGGDTSTALCSTWHLEAVFPLLVIRPTSVSLFTRMQL